MSASHHKDQSNLRCLRVQSFNSFEVRFVIIEQHLQRSFDSSDTVAGNAFGLSKLTA